MPGRKFVSGEEYRFGFNGKEDDRDWGMQNIQDYGFRLYNPSIGKFLSVDPLSPDYPWNTPYQFAGNKPIWAVDLDGLEPGFLSPLYGKNVVLGSKRTVEDVNNDPNNGRWNAFRAQDIFIARDKVRDLKANGVKIETILIQHHANTEYMQLSAPEYVDNYDMAGPLSDLSVHGTEIGEEQMKTYLEYIDLPREEQDNFNIDNFSLFHGERILESIQALDEIANSIEDGGTLIIGGCLVGNSNIGDAISELNPDITIYTNMDLSQGVNSDKGSFLGSPISFDMFLDGWKRKSPGEASEEIKKDLQLNPLVPVPGDFNYEEVQESND